MTNIIMIDLHDPNIPISDFTPSPNKIIGKRNFIWINTSIYLAARSTQVSLPI